MALSPEERTYAMARLVFAALGPLTDTDIKALVESAASPGFQEGMQAATSDLDAIAEGASPDAYGLVRFPLCLN